MKATGGTTPLPSTGAVSSSSSGSGELANRMAKGATRRDQPELKAACLARDNNRCVISGIVDVSQEDQAYDVEEDRTGRTQCAHVIPFSMGKVMEKNVSNTYACKYLIPG